MAEAAAGVSTAAAVDSMAAALAGFTAVDFTAVDSTAGDLAGFTAAVSMSASPACTMVSGTRTAATGTTAGTADATAGGGVLTGWGGLTTQIPGGVTRTTVTTTTTSLTLPSIGTTAPIRQATTLMCRSVIRLGRPFRPAKAARPNPHPAPSVRPGEVHRVSCRSK